MNNFRECRAQHTELGAFIDRHEFDTCLLFADTMTWQPDFPDRPHRVSAMRAHTDRVVDLTSWIGVYPGLTESMPHSAADKISECTAQ
jgi:CDP-6-deoxy-D-xylo-4-hexulose-3-dehydrase